MRWPRGFGKGKLQEKRLVAARKKPVKEPVPKRMPEERAEGHKEAPAKAREAKRAEKAKYDVLMAVLAESGTTVDDLLPELRA